MTSKKELEFVITDPPAFESLATGWIATAESLRDIHDADPKLDADTDTLEALLEQVWNHGRESRADGPLPRLLERAGHDDGLHVMFARSLIHGDRWHVEGPRRETEAEARADLQSLLARDERRTPEATDWTVGDGRSNNGAFYLHLVADVASVIENCRVGDSPEVHARTIVSRMAHVHDLAPRPSDAPLCFHAAKGKRCTRYLEGSTAERAQTVAWLRSLDQDAYLPSWLASQIEAGKTSTRDEALAWSKGGPTEPEGPLAGDPVAVFDAWAKGHTFTEEERTTSATAVVEIDMQSRARPLELLGHHAHTCPKCHEHVPCADRCAVEPDLVLDDDTERGAYVDCASCVRPSEAPTRPEPSHLRKWLARQILDIDRAVEDEDWDGVQDVLREMREHQDMSRPTAERSPNDATPRTAALVECRGVLESIWIHGRLNEDLLRRMLAAIEGANAALGPREVAEDDRPDYPISEVIVLAMLQRIGGAASFTRSELARAEQRSLIKVDDGHLVRLSSRSNT